MPAKSKRHEKPRLAAVIGEDLASVHTELSASGGFPKGEAEQRLGTDTVHALTDLGLAHIVPHTPTSPATFQAVRLDWALTGLLARLQTKVVQDHEQIMACVEMLRELLDGAGFGGEEDPRQLVRIILNKDEICKLSLELIYSAQHDWMTLENTATDMPITEDFGVPIPPSQRGKIRHRSIFDHAAIEHPAMGQHIDTFIAEGGEARVVKTVVMKLQLAETAAMMPLTPTASGGAVLIRGSGVPVLLMLRDYFEMMWANATRIGLAGPPPGCGLTAEQRQILRLMADGLTDAAIAIRIGCGERTVSRRIAEILEGLNLPSKSRFVAGAIAQRRGWLPDDLGTSRTG
jgi:DNA-binding CsgD family transcriptional regulator